MKSRSNSTYGIVAGSIAVGAIGTALALSGSPIAAGLVAFFGLMAIFQ